MSNIYVIKCNRAARYLKANYPYSSANIADALFLTNKKEAQRIAEYCGLSENSIVKVKIVEVK